MEKIDRIINSRQNYKRLKKPLKAARVCGLAREIFKDIFEAISFKEGILTVGVSSSAEAANLHQESEEIIKRINQKLGEKAVEKIRFKIQ